MTMARPDGPGSCLTAESLRVSGHSPCDPSRGWQPMYLAPQDGTWVWGEWPALDYGPGRRAPRIVAPMRWMAPDDVHVEHWCRGGRLTVGDDPVRWAPISPPPSQGMEAPVAETEGLGAKPDSPVVEDDAPPREAAIKSKSTEESAA